MTAPGMAADAGTWPVRSMAETTAILIAPGAPFEMTTVSIAGRQTRVYVRALPHLRTAFDASLAWGDREFLVYADERLSFAEHWRQATAFGHALLAQGVGKGDCVAVAMRNYPEWSVCAWGAIAIGAVFVPLNAWESGDVLGAQLADSGARVAVVDAERYDRLAPHAGGCRLIGTRGAATADTLACAIGEWREAAVLPDPGIDPDDAASLFYTSGTTGRAKGVVHSHRNIATNLVNVGYRAARAAVRRDDHAAAPAAAQRTQLVPVPLFHVTGFHSALVPALAAGNRLVLMHKWDAAEALTLIEREHVNALSLVPSQAIQLVDAAATGGHDVASIDTVGYGGAKAPASLAAAVRRVFPRAQPGQGYGATETSSLVASNGAEDMLARPDSVGPVVPVCDVRIDAAPGLPGEIMVRGPNVVNGYRHAPAATAAAFEDGWYRTGDIGLIDDQGFLSVFDRTKDMLIRGGENIFCGEVEEAILAHPAVMEVAVIGLPDRVLGEVVGAVVVLLSGHVADRSALDDAIASLPPHKRPVAWFVRDTPLPCNAAGKVLKRALKDEYAGPADHG